MAKKTSVPEDPKASESRVRITDFAGMSPGTDLHDNDPGESWYQVNVVPFHPGELRVRRGFVVCRFEVGPDTVLVAPPLVRYATAASSIWMHSDARRGRDVEANVYSKLVMMVHQPTSGVYSSDTFSRFVLTSFAVTGIHGGLLASDGLHQSLGLQCSFAHHVRSQYNLFASIGLHQSSRFQGDLTRNIVGHPVLTANTGLHQSFGSQSNLVQHARSQYSLSASIGSHQNSGFQNDMMSSKVGHTTLFVSIGLHQDSGFQCSLTQYVHSHSNSLLLDAGIYHQPNFLSEGLSALAGSYVATPDDLFSVRRWGSSFGAGVYYQSDLMNYSLDGSLGSYIGSGYPLLNSRIIFRLLAVSGVYHQSDLMGYGLFGFVGSYGWAGNSSDLTRKNRLIASIGVYHQSDLMSYGLRGSTGSHAWSSGLFFYSSINHRLSSSIGVYHQSDLMSYGLRGSTGLYMESGRPLNQSRINYRVLAGVGVYHQSDLMNYGLRGSVGSYVGSGKSGNLLKSRRVFANVGLYDEFGQSLSMTSRYDLSAGIGSCACS